MMEWRRKLFIYICNFIKLIQLYKRNIILKRDLFLLRYMATEDVLLNSADYLWQQLSGYASQVAVALDGEWRIVEEGLRSVADSFTFWWTK